MAESSTLTTLQIVGKVKRLPESIQNELVKQGVVFEVIALYKCEMCCERFGFIEVDNFKQPAYCPMCGRENQNWIGAGKNA